MTSDETEIIDRILGASVRPAGKVMLVAIVQQLSASDRHLFDWLTITAKELGEISNVAERTLFRMAASMKAKGMVECRAVHTDRGSWRLGRYFHSQPSTEDDRPTTCDGCGACCMRLNLLPLSGNETQLANSRLSKDMRVELEAVLAGPLNGDDGCPCIWLDRLTGKCIHYDRRPSECRDFQVGDDTCMRIRREAGVQ